LMNRSDRRLHVMTWMHISCVKRVVNCHVQVLKLIFIETIKNLTDELRIL